MGENILIIEDELKLARFVELELKYEGYEVDMAHDGRSGLEKAESGKYAMVLLDVMLPMMNGMEVLRRIRQSSEVPVIMLTAKDEIMDKVMGLDTGANDYVTKPFAIEELLARIRALLKRSTQRKSDSNVLQMGSLKIFLDKYSVTYNDDIIDLTKREFELLKYLMENKNIVLSRETLLEKVWGYEYAGETNVVDVYVRYLRSKIDDKYNKKLIHTVRGVGFLIKDE